MRWSCGQSESQESLLICISIGPLILVHWSICIGSGVASFELDYCLLSIGTSSLTMYLHPARKLKISSGKLNVLNRTIQPLAFEYLSANLWHPCDWRQLSQCLASECLVNHSVYTVTCGQMSIANEDSVAEIQSQQL